MPFLLVVIAIFLGAAVATMQIGKSALKMTCTDNAADACSLAAASKWALALNTLKERNVEFGDAYRVYYTQLQQLILASNRELFDAQNYINMAQQKVISANREAIIAAFVSANCSIWGSALTASILYNSAAMLIKKAYESFAAARSYNSTIKELTDYMKMYQRNRFCDFVYSMIESKILAEVTGAKYAETYNCTSVPVGAEVDVPGILSYEVEVTKMDNPCPTIDPYNLVAFEIFSAKLNDIAYELGIASEVQYSNYTDSRRGNYYCDESWAAFRRGNFIRAGWLWAKAMAIYTRIRAVAIFAATIKGISYARWMNNLNTDWPTIQDLIIRNEKIAEALGVAGGVGAGRIVSLRTCEAGDMLIIGIKHVTFEKGCVSCKLGEDSQSTAAFSDSNKGNMDPRYLGVGFTPRIAGNDGSCPGNGGVDTSSPKSSPLPKCQ